jgi:hypothetical protein
VKSTVVQAVDDAHPVYRNIHGERALYIGPDTLMPVASVFAAVAGFVLMFWRRLVGAVKLLVQRLTGRASQQ